MRLCAILTSFFLFLASCSSLENPERAEEMRQWRTPNGKIKVLSTIAMIHDLVRSVGGDHVDSLTLITEQLDPHSYQLVKGDDEKLAFPHIVFYNGLGLEHGPSLRKQLETLPNAVALGDLIRKEEPALILHQDGVVDPHIWMDVSLWMKAIPYIVDALSEADPGHKGAYQENGQQLKQRLGKVHQEIYEVLQGIPPEKRYLVTSHDAFNYFARVYLATDEERVNGRWRERFVAPEGLAPDSRLSTSDIQLIIDHLKQFQIPVIFPESNVSRDSLRKIDEAGREKGLDVKVAECYLYGDAMGGLGSDGDSYQRMMLHNGKMIAHYLSGNTEIPEDCRFNPEENRE